jgi:hypothetical protein
MRGHGDKRSLVLCCGFDDHLFGLALLYRAFCIGAGKCTGNPSQVLFTVPHTIFNHGIEVTGSVSGDMGCHFDNINGCQKLYGKLQTPREKTSVGQYFFSRLRSVQRYQYLRVHRFLPVTCYCPTLAVCLIS